MGSLAEARVLGEDHGGRDIDHVETRFSRLVEPSPANLGIT